MNSSLLWFVFCVTWEDTFNKSLNGTTKFVLLFLCSLPLKPGPEFRDTEKHRKLWRTFPRWRALWIRWREKPWRTSLSWWTNSPKPSTTRKPRWHRSSRNCVHWGNKRRSRIFRPSPTKSGRAYGVMNVRSVVVQDLHHPHHPPAGWPLLGWPLGPALHCHVMVSHDGW